MGVPDTRSFGLRNVVDALVADGVSPAPTSLRGCFTDATDIKFDPDYKGSKDRLSNFRNYNNPKIAIIRPYLSYTKDKGLYSDGSGWTNVKGCVYSWAFTPVGGIYKIGVVEGVPDVYGIWRSFLAFDLRYLTGTATEAELRLRIVASTGNEWCWVMRASWRAPLAVGDACRFYAVPLLSGTHSDYQQGDSSYVHKAESVSENMTVFNSDAMAHMLYTALLHTKDYQNDPPNYPENLYRTFYKGTGISQSLVWNAELRVKYWGPHFLGVYPGEWGNKINFAQSYSGGARVFVSADNQNEWAAAVTMGGTWLSITDAGTATGSFKFEISVTVNNGVPRSGQITVQSDAIYDQIVYVEQDGYRLTASPDPWNADPAGDVQWITVEANPENSWTATVTLGAAWLSITPPYTGQGNGGFNLTADENTGGPRSGEVTITSDAADYVVNVEQYPQA